MHAFVVLGLVFPYQAKRLTQLVSCSLYIFVSDIAIFVLKRDVKLQLTLSLQVLIWS